ncbi:aldehyde dehydrogenase family protein [Aerococcus kribbianus]|uniref:aldehyde dehydrogenase (NAD(+)) n=1 Tax=Aerococcus kribbianus TaxID=2999064 RepID=A0A9X3FVX4_9LACT|nr:MULTISPECIES: aldehyde dehydrogenase family protein [unclassified Aerococcus]MCZ0717209.1 aldehyde dehydrogenase family protein [Aerococcus sp. YH-aer221]MCZ0725497.1 aldehyde dehydrogenase family protein [Aerococcus sp. YH-aer222]
MKQYQLFIDGQWVDSHSGENQAVINPATEEEIAQIQMGNQEDVNDAVAAAKAAFPEWTALDPKERAQYVQKIADGIAARADELLDAVVTELGAPRSFAEYMQIKRTPEEMEASIAALDDVEFTEEIDNAKIVKEGVGVVAAINPWNFPLNQIQRKMTSALLAGNTIVVKPASETPITAMILADIVQEADLPAGVFNLITGSGSGLGAQLAGHPDVGLISFTGSTEVGKGLYDQAKGTVKKLVLELGGKSAMIYLDGGDLDLAVESSIDTILNNSGQVCTALTRLLVPADKLAEVEAKAIDYIKQVQVGDPNDPETRMGPLVSKKQEATVLEYIEKGKAEGAKVLIGGEKLDRKGYFVAPTVFTNVSNDMTIAQEEIFGPVLSIITYDSVEEAIELANDTTYGLSGAVVGPDDQAEEVALQLRTGNIIINGASQPHGAPFGGYKESGYGHERGKYGIEDYLDMKSIYH